MKNEINCLPIVLKVYEKSQFAIPWAELVTRCAAKSWFKIHFSKQSNLVCVCSFLCIDQGIKNEFASGCYPSFPFLCCWTCINIVFSLKSPHLLFLFHTNLYQLYIHTIFSLFCTTREHHFSQSQSLNSKWHLCLSGPVPRYSMILWGLLPSAPGISPGRILKGLP